RLLRHAAEVDAGAAKLAGLDQGHPRAMAGGAEGRCQPARTATHHGEVDVEAAVGAHRKRSGAYGRGSIRGSRPQIRSATSWPVAGLMLTPIIPWPVATQAWRRPGTRPMIGTSSTLSGRQPYHSSRFTGPTGSCRNSAAPRSSAPSRRGLRSVL